MRGRIGGQEWTVDRECVVLVVEVVVVVLVVVVGGDGRQC